MKEVSAQQDEIDSKEKRYQQTQERTGALARANAAARRDVARASEDLGSSLKTGQDLIGADTEAWRANTIVLRENLGLRQQIRQLGGTTAAPAPIAAAPAPVAGTRAPRAPAVVPAGDLQSAREAERAAIARAEQARLDVAEARKAKAPPESIATLTQTRGEATAAAQAARRNVTALEREAAASEAASAAAREKAVADERATRASMLKAEADDLAARASRVEAAGRAVSGRAPLQLGPASAIPVGPAGAPLEYLDPSFNRYGGVSGGGGGGRGRPPAPPGGMGGAGGQDDYNRKLKETAATAETAAVSERTLQHDVQAAGAAYAASSNALSRHGALTTEFIQALARGDVTLREFSSQMVSTIGKFGGWLVAGAAIFGVIKLFDDLKAGALDTQEAIVNLGRFLPGLGGPAGGGSGQIGQAQEVLRDISTQFNVPIKEVSESMQVVSRVFHNLGEAGDATRAVLAASRLDQIPAAQSTQYLLGISQSLGFADRPGGGAQLIGIVQSLNELQSRGGARVAQTLPAYARAAPAALAGGVSQNTLETLTAMGVTAGIQPGTVGTALARTIGGYIFQPRAQALLSSYGIAPSATSAEGSIRGIFELITRRRDEGRPLGQRELREIAVAISTPNLATRTILPILEQQQKIPGRFEQFSEQLAHPRPIQQDLDATLSSITERFKGIGNSLQNFGSQLASIGALTPITAFFDTLQFLAEAFQNVATPVEEVVKAFEKIPGPIEKIVLAAGLAYAAQRLYKSTFIGSTAEDFAGRLAGRDEFERSPRQVIRQRLADARNVLLPEEEAQQQTTRRAAFLAQQRYASAQREMAAFEERSQGVGRGGIAFAPGEAGEMYEAGYAQRGANVSTTARKRQEAERAAANAAEQVARREADIGLMKEKTLSWSEKVALMEERGYVAAEATTNLRQQQNEILAGQIAGLRGGARAGGTLAGATAGAAAAGVTAAAMVDEVTKPGNMAKVADAIGRGQGAVHGPEVAPLEFYPTMSPVERRVRESLGEAVPPESPSLAARRVQEYSGGPPLGAQEMSGLMAIQALEESQQRMRRPAALAEGLRQTRAGQMIERRLSAVADFAANNAAALPFAGILATQAIASTVGGGVGGAISKIGEPAFTGAMISQMLGKGIGVGAGAGLVLGGFQQGGPAGAIAGGVGGALLGRGAASAIAALAPADVLAPEIALPIQGALAVGGAALSLFGGGSKSPQDEVNDAARRARRAITSTQGIGGSVDTFSNEFGSSVQDAITGSGDAASKGSAFVQKALEGLTAQMQLFGSASQEGQKAQQELAQVVSTASSLLSTDPAMAQQILQGVQTAGQQVVTRTTRLLKYADPRQAMQIAQQGISQLDVSGTRETGLRADVVEDRAILAREQARLAAARPGDQIVSREAPTTRLSLGGTTVTGTQNVAKLREAVATAKQKLDATSAELKQIDLMRREMTEQIALVALQAQSRGEVTRVATAQARTGDPFQQQFLSTWEANRQLQRARTSPLLHGQARADAIQQALTARQQAQVGMAQTIAGGIEAQGAVTAAAIPSTNPLGRANAALRTATAVYNRIKRYMQTHAAANNPQLLAQYLAQMLAAQQGVADTAQQQATELAASQEQLAEAQAHGDPGLIAAAQKAHGYVLLGRAKTQTQKNEARAMIISAEDAGVDATRQWADAQTSLAEARAHGDAGLIAAAELAGGQRDLGLAKNKFDRAAALTRIANAQTAAGEAARATADAQTQVAVAGDFGDSVAQANDAIAGAHRDLGLAQTGAERLAAQAGLLNAVNEREQAIAERYNEFAALAASETLDPVAAAKDLADGAQKALNATTGVDNRTKAQTNRNQLLQSYRALKIDTKESEINFEFQMSEISSGAAISLLQGLLKMKGLTKAKRQEILEEIRRFETGQESPIGGGGFNLAPGNVRLPTFYDVAHARRGAHMRSATHPNIDASTATNITVNVHRDADVGKVADVIDRATSSQLRARLRAAGVR
ncbi:MAG: hypothetical protein ACJ780_09925 [Solirubrobacteraceae bacterium]